MLELVSPDNDSDNTHSLRFPRLRSSLSQCIVFLFEVDSAVYVARKLMWVSCQRCIGVNLHGYVCEYAMYVYYNVSSLESAVDCVYNALVTHCFWAGLTFSMF